MSTKESYEKKIEAQLKEWKLEIDKLKAKADKAEADTQIEYYKKIKDLRAKQTAVEEKLKELKAAGEDAWEDIKIGLTDAVNTLGDAVNLATSRFK